MKNDPLLNAHIETPPAAPIARTARTSTRKKHPAISARILAVGLSTTALIGLTTGYTLSQKVSALQPAAGRILLTASDPELISMTTEPDAPTWYVVVVLSKTED